ncbi:two component transcriptional regulator, LuxR family [Micromonospora sagamiensis]|uniref:Two component transcriptional regulator, LuxR family n=1 Tax=Micromonospora sagamiensis TaxID=47875 RepID=A0A562WE88_9ACTN|nr:response regulator transcription factor [Micromonospora sagamiensis]TWJ28589.1 two component transcriptional regulator, LuxR family [Micromonospora sagamiensis]
MIRVLVAEDMHLIGGALAALIELEEDMRVAGRVATGEEAVASAVELRPEVVVLDIHMPGRLDGLDAARELRERAPECGLLMLTSMGTPESLRRALAIGARGFMVKDAPPTRLAEAIRRVAAGETVVDPDLAAAAITGRPNPLSRREAQVLRRAGEGAELAEIAAEFFLSKGTVRNYLGAIVTKLAARNRLDAVRIAAENGWI